MSGDGDDWSPVADLTQLRKRAEALARIRTFFAERGVMEVDTPALLSQLAPDPWMDYFAAEAAQPGGPRFLGASPEACMKRLLAAGSGSIYQLGKAFRNAEYGRWHNPEFTLLEWYRPGWSGARLRAESAALVTCFFEDITTYKTITYKDLFMSIINIDPHRGELAELRAAAAVHNPSSAVGESRSECLQLLFSHRIEPWLSEAGLVFVVDYPVCEAVQAALARDRDGQLIARRFEMYLQGVELANGSEEEQDPRRLAARFEEFQLRQWGKTAVRPPLDRRLLAAIEAGIGQVSGVALGVDRLLALAGGHAALAPVLAFPWSRS